ncbi:uncharacterized protein F5147DRAFT_771645 [Suillus discolor]|uniref:Uncharacterized protein n=1 Tax=Suillus discolor TaxID=1912936 RepID=A0A9P7JVX3_9AGAM|nr:uncharacterized protein F5147DRAFT_771645 [Suillus discolor]KAG2111496.1 hypothetical protein F5147DRAFT_771645 [Suillus discolor]
MTRGHSKQLSTPIEMTMETGPTVPTSVASSLTSINSATTPIPCLSNSINTRRPQPHIRTNSNSDSDSNIEAPAMSATVKFTHVESASVSKPPVLTAGELTPEVLRSWEMGCTQFFLYKEVKDIEIVKRVAWGMQEPV